MSGRIRLDEAGPGSQTPSPAENENRERTRPEPADEQNVETASDSPEAEEATQRPRDDDREASGERSEREADEPSGREELSPELKKRLDRLKWEGNQARRELAEARAQLSQLQQQQQRQQQPDPERDAEERAYQRMQQERLEQDFNRDCNTLWQKGLDEYGNDMEEAKRGLDAVGWGGRPDALAALTALPDGHRIYRELGADLDNAARILSLPPMRMAVELARMSRDENVVNAANVSRETNREPVPERQTRAPQPLRPIGGNSRRAEMRLDDPKMTIAEHIRQRDRDQWGNSRIRR